jgi:hypothetical protein
VQLQLAVLSIFLAIWSKDYSPSIRHGKQFYLVKSLTSLLFPTLNVVTKIIRVFVLLLDYKMSG